MSVLAIILGAVVFVVILRVIAAAYLGGPGSWHDHDSPGD